MRLLRPGAIPQRVGKREWRFPCGSRVRRSSRRVGGGEIGRLPHWGLAYREKGLASATKYFSGNGVSLAAISIQERQTLALKVKLDLMLSEKS
jgi:hypothetical protein